MKKYIVPILVTVFSLFCLSGCSKQQDSAQSKTLIRAAAPSYDKDYITVGFIQTGKESDWRDANTNDYLDIFTKENGYNLIYIDGNSNPERQRKAAYDLITQRVDYIILDPIIEDGWDEVLELAAKQHIPVIITDRNVSSDSSLFQCWIGSDFKKEGVNAAKWLQSYLIESERENEDINLVILEGTEGASATIGRTEGLLSEINKHKNWHILTIQCANFTQGEGKLVMDDILSSYKDIDVVIAENDNMMFGAMKAMDRVGLSYGASGDVITISFDALYEAFLLMQEQKLMVSVECNPLIAGIAEQVIQDLEAGKEISPIYYAEESVFTYKNAQHYIQSRKY